MGGRRALARRLEAVRRFDDPRVDLEQYPTPPEIAAHIVHFADLRSDIDQRVVVDLGSGSGMLALAAACRTPASVIGVEVDRTAIEIAVENERELRPVVPVEWIHADVLRLPIGESVRSTVLMNPPFGAQKGNIHADRAFLEAASRIARVSYSLHNAGSREFVESFATDHGGTVTDAATAEFDLERQFSFHRKARTDVPVELYRIEW